MRTPLAELALYGATNKGGKGKGDTSDKGKGKGKGKGKNAKTKGKPVVESAGTKPVCFHFLKGACKFGDACRKVHNTWGFKLRISCSFVFSSLARRDNVVVTYI